MQFAGFCDWPGLTGLVADAGKLRRLSCSQDDFIYFLPVAATSLRAGFQVYLSKLWVADVTKAVRYDLLIYCLLSDIILYFLLVAVAATSLFVWSVSQHSPYFIVHLLCRHVHVKFSKMCVYISHAYFPLSH